MVREPMHGAIRRRVRVPVLLVVLALAGPAQAARLLHFEVLRDGQVALDMYAEDDGRSAAVVWQYMADPRRDAFEVMDISAVMAEPGNPKRGTMTGNIVVRVTHGNAILAQAVLDELKLEREDPSRDVWRLPPAEVQRTAAVAGLGPPPPTLAQQIDRRAVIAMAVLGLLVVGGTVVVAWLVRRASRRDADGAAGPGG